MRERIARRRVAGARVPSLPLIRTSAAVDAIARCRRQGDARGPRGQAPRARAPDGRGGQEEEQPFRSPSTSSARPQLPGESRDRDAGPCSFRSPRLERLEDRPADDDGIRALARSSSANARSWRAWRLPRVRSSRSLHGCSPRHQSSSSAPASRVARASRSRSSRVQSAQAGSWDPAATTTNEKRSSVMATPSCVRTMPQ